MALGQLPRIVGEACEFEREFFRCAGRGVAVRLKCNNDLVRSRNEAAFFAPMALGQPLSLEVAGAEQKCKGRGDDKYSDPTWVDDAIRARRLTGFLWRGGFHCLVCFRAFLEES